MSDLLDGTIETHRSIARGAAREAGFMAPVAVAETIAGDWDGARLSWRVVRRKLRAAAYHWACATELKVRR